MAFHQNIFINCPFDNSYKPILKSTVFCIVYLGYNPILSETIDSGESRVKSIQELIKNSKYSVHDLSRMVSSKKNEIARFNMPFELGLDMGCKYFGTQDQKQKCLLILDREKYRYQKAISDISGNDIATHNEEPEKALRQVRNWIRKIKGQQIDGANKIWKLYNKFNSDFHNITVHYNELSNADIEEMPWKEYVFYIQEWISGRDN